jgi:hypothetical protein
MSKRIPAKCTLFSTHELSLGKPEQANREPAGGLGREAGPPPDPTLEQIRAVKGTLSFLTALITFYGELIEQDAHASNGTATAGRKGANLQ